MPYSVNPQRDKEYHTIESLAARALNGELGDVEKALDTIRRAAWTLKMNEKIVEGIIGAVRDSLKGITE